MKRLILLRHAKSDWSSGASTDHARPLNARGRKDAPRVGAFMAANGYVPDMILSSDSKRTRETLELTMAEWDRSPEIIFSPDLYHASESTLLRAAAKAPDTCTTLMLVGHNPGMHGLAANLMATEERHNAPFLYGNYPTAGLAVFALNIPNWKSAAFHTASLECYQTPKSIKEF